MLVHDGPPGGRGETPCSGCGGSRRLKLIQPEGANGSPEPIIDRTVGATSLVLDAWINEMLRNLPATASPGVLRAAVDNAALDFPTDAFVAHAAEGAMHGVMLGALDSHYEASSKDLIVAPEFEPPKEEVEITLATGHRAARLLAATRIPGFIDLPYTEAVKAFLGLKPVTRKVFDALDDKARRNAFTVANTAKKKIVRTVQLEIARQVGQGADFRDFRDIASKRLERAGWTAKNPTHLENVFRTGVSKAHAAGKWEHSLRPTVRRLRPFVQIVTVNDGPPRQRPTHQALHLRVLRIDNPIWAIKAPPFGYQCRCKTRTLPASYSGPVETDLPGVPDPGFMCGTGTLMGQGEGPLPPAQDTAVVPSPRRPRAVQVPDDIAPPPTVPTFEPPRALPPQRDDLPDVAAPPVAPPPLVPEFVPPPPRAEDLAPGVSEYGVAIRTEAKDVEETSKKLFGKNITPEQVKGMTAHEPLSAIGKFSGTMWFGDGTINYRGAVHAADAAGDPLVTTSRTFKKVGKKTVVDHNTMFIDSSVQGKGVGREVLRAQVATYLELGVDEIHLSAIDIGRYYWPKIGFNLSKAEVARFKNKFYAWLRQNAGVSGAKADEVTNGIKSMRDIAITRIGDRKGGKEFLLSSSTDSYVDGFKIKLKPGDPGFEAMKRELGL